MSYSWCKEFLLACENTITAGLGCSPLFTTRNVPCMRSWPIIDKSNIRMLFSKSIDELMNCKVHTSTCITETFPINIPVLLFSQRSLPYYVHYCAKPFGVFYWRVNYLLKKKEKKNIDYIFIFTLQKCSPFKIKHII